jgi:hypothetical protein
VPHQGDVLRDALSQDEYIRALTEYNPQRVKSVDAILSETFLRVDEATLEEMQLKRPQLVESKSSRLVLGAKSSSPPSSRSSSV